MEYEKLNNINHLKFTKWYILVDYIDLNFKIEILSAPLNASMLDIVRRRKELKSGPVGFKVENRSLIVPNDQTY